MSQSRAIALIPARLESSRLARKALVDICGLPMIIHVLKRSLMAKSLSEVYVATDSEEIHHVVAQYGGKVVMTSSKHQTGTDRIAEAAETLDCEIVVNIQGDEALVHPDHIDAGVNALRADSSIDITILVNRYLNSNKPSDIKTVLNENNDVMYFSRNDIPSDARTPNPERLKAYHIVTFRKNFLFQYANWDRTRLEAVEFNEYLRILEKGCRIRAVHVESTAVSVDTPADLDFVCQQMTDDPLLPAYR